MLLGPPGSGKTSILEVICGLRPLAGGRSCWAADEWRGWTRPTGRSGTFRRTTPCFRRWGSSRISPSVFGWPAAGGGGGPARGADRRPHGHLRPADPRVRWALRGRTPASRPGPRTGSGAPGAPAGRAGGCPGRTDPPAGLSGASRPARRPGNDHSARQPQFRRDAFRRRRGWRAPRGAANAVGHGGGGLPQAGFRVCRPVRAGRERAPRRGRNRRHGRGAGWSWPGRPWMCHGTCRLGRQPCCCGHRTRTSCPKQALSPRARRAWPQPS